MLTEGWLETLRQRIPLCSLLMLVDPAGKGESRIAGSLADLDADLDLTAIQATATDLEIGDKLLELQSLVRDDVPAAEESRRRETLFLADGVVLFFVCDPGLGDATLIAVCEPGCNLGLLKALVRSTLQSLVVEVVA